MKRKILFLICCLLYSPIGQTEGEPPLTFWSANKAGKTIYMLGTIHYGLSLEDYQCAPGIKSYITDSKLLFVETTLSTDYLPSLEDRKSLLIGSESEKRLVMEKIPEQDRDKLIEAFESRKKWFDWNVIRPSLGFKLESKESVVFQDLSLKSQEFLTNHGFQQSKYNSEELLKEIYYFILLTVFYDAYYDIGKYLDLSVQFIAKQNAVPIRALDNKKLDSEEQIYDTMFEKPILQIGISDIEELIDNYEKSKETRKLDLERNIQQVLNLLNLTSNENIFFDFLGSLIQKALNLISDNKLNNVLLRDRNVIWLEKIMESLKEEENNKIFVAGGAMHFIGMDNVIDMLKDEGFDITRLYCSGESLQP